MSACGYTRVAGAEVAVLAILTWLEVTGVRRNRGHPTDMAGGDWGLEEQRTSNYLMTCAQSHESHRDS